MSRSRGKKNNIRKSNASSPAELFFS
jgi:hypothetical protein